MRLHACAPDSHVLQSLKRVERRWRPPGDLLTNPRRGENEKTRPARHAPGKVPGGGRAERVKLDLRWFSPRPPLDCRPSSQCGSAYRAVPPTADTEIIAARPPSKPVRASAFLTRDRVRRGGDSCVAPNRLSAVSSHRRLFRHHEQHRMQLDAVRSAPALRVYEVPKPNAVDRGDSLTRHAPKRVAHG